jgi:extradiol dioxygenase family protein
MQQLNPFHLAIPVKNLSLSRDFYTNTLELTEGRSDTHWVDYDFFGHQFVIHESKTQTSNRVYSKVDGHDVPVPHFGVVLNWEAFWEFAQLLTKKNIEFIIEPYIRFKDKPGEQATLFFQDPSDNALEFKSFKNPDQLFAQ